MRLRQLALDGCNLYQRQKGRGLGGFDRRRFRPSLATLAQTRDFPNSKNPHNASRMILSFEKLHAWGLKLNGCPSALNAHEL